MSLLACPAHAQSTGQVITATITVTNTPSAGDTIVINSSTRRWTNNTPASAATWIQTGSGAGPSATNLYTQLAGYPVSSVILTRSSTNVVTLRGSTLGVTVSGTWATLTVSTQGGPILESFMIPSASHRYATNATNQANALVDTLSRYASTNAIATNSQALTNYLTKGAHPGQTISSPVTAHNFSGNLRNVTNGIRWGGTNASPINSNLVNYGNAIRSEGAGGNSLQVGSNALAKGSLSLAIGNDSVASNSYSAAIGNGASALYQEGLAVGWNAASTAQSGTAIGSQASASTNALAVGVSSQAGSLAMAVGPFAVASGIASAAIGYSPSASAGFSTAIGQLASATETNSIAIGRSASADHSNTVVIGFSAASTASNQIRLGTALHTVSIPGRLQMEGAATNFLADGTNTLRGSYAWPRFDITTLANGNNVAVPFGTNRFIRLAGTLTGVASIVGIVGSSTSGANDGHDVVVFNDTGYTVTFAQSTSDPTSANRIETPTGSDVSLADQGWAGLTYTTSDSRWHLMWSYPATTTATVTNAIGTIRTNGVAVTASATVLDVISGTNVLVVATNTAGVVTMQFNATGSGGGGGSSLQTNANQFGPSVVLTIKASALVTNINLYGTTTAAGKIDAEGGIALPNVTASRAAIINGSGDVTNSTATATEVGYLSGVTSAIQTQLDGKVDESSGVATNTALHGTTSIRGLGIPFNLTGASINASNSAHFITTNADTTFTLDGTVPPGQQVWLTFSNSATTSKTFTLPAAFHPAWQSNVTAWPVAASNRLSLLYVRATNAAASMWEVAVEGSVQYSLAAGSGVTFTTNGTTITIAASGGGSGDITSVGDVASGAAFDGTAGTALGFKANAGQVWVATEATNSANVVTNYVLPFTGAIPIVLTNSGAISGNTNSTTEADLLANFIIPSNILSGSRKVRIHMSGLARNGTFAAAITNRLRVYLGGSVIYDDTILNNWSSTLYPVPWDMDVTLQPQSTTAQSVHGIWRFGGASAAPTTGNGSVNDDGSVNAIFAARSSVGTFTNVPVRITQQFNPADASLYMDRSSLTISVEGYR